MANTTIVSGVNSYILYGAESTYGTAVAGTTHFGLVQSFKASLNNNLSQNRGFAGTTTGGRKIFKNTAGTFQHSLSVEFLPQLWDWLQYAVGARTGTGTGADPFIYLPGASATSLTIRHNINNSTTDREEIYLGCMINSTTIRASVGEPVSVSLDIVGGDMDKDATLTAGVALGTGDPYTFVSGSIEVPNASAIPNIIDSAEITITNNAEVVYGLFSRVGQAGIFKGLDCQVKFTVKYVDETLIDLFHGSATDVGTPTESATVALRFANGANKYVDFVFAAGTMDGFDENANLNELITEDITYICEDVTITEQQTA